MKTIKYINLTNGIESLKDFPVKIGYRFTRIQSTALEQNHFESVLVNLDNDLLMNLALGNCCIIYDRGSRRSGVSRALWYGVPWIKYVLNRIWFKREIESFIHPDKNTSINVTNYFRTLYRNLSKTTKKKIRYFVKFLFCNDINLEYSSSRTIHDGDTLFYKNILSKFVLNNDNKVCFQEAVLNKNP